MTARLMLKVLHDANPNATPAEGHCNMNAGQFCNPVAKKPDSAAADRLSFGDRHNEQPIGKDEIVAWVLSNRQVDFGSRRRATPVPTYNVLPVRAQRLLCKGRRGVHGDQTRTTTRCTHTCSLTVVSE